VPSEEGVTANRICRFPKTNRKIAHSHVSLKRKPRKIGYKTPNLWSRIGLSAD